MNLQELKEKLQNAKDYYDAYNKDLATVLEVLTGVDPKGDSMLLEGGVEKPSSLLNDLDNLCLGLVEGSRKYARLLKVLEGIVIKPDEKTQTDDIGYHSHY